MTAIRTALFLALTALTLSCGGASPSRPPPQPASNKVDVGIASVTLASDCGTPPVTAPPAPVATESRTQHPEAESDRDESSRRICRQSSLQLRIANHTTAPSTIVIRKIEMLDEAGTVLGELTPRAPSRWDADAYQGWDEHVAPGDTIEASYALSDPAAEPGKIYIVRVTVDAGDGERMLEERSMLEVEASLPPMVET